MAIAQLIIEHYNNCINIYIIIYTYKINSFSYYILCMGNQKYCNKIKQNICGGKKMIYFFYFSCDNIYNTYTNK